VRRLERVRHLWRAVALASVVCLGACNSQPVESGPVAREDVNLPRATSVVAATVPANATLEMLFLRHQLPRQLVAPIVDAVRTVFDPRRIKAEQSYELTSSLDGSFREFRYRIDLDRVLRVTARETGGAAAFDADIVEIPRHTERAAVSVAITPDTPSLVAALDAAGEDIELGLVLADILGGEIDFNTELQPGDTLEVLFDRIVREDGGASYGDVHVAVMHNGDRELSAVRFAGSDGKGAYYDRQGRSLKRQFLRSPLALSRVTSGFSRRRLHPVHGTYRAHLGVDYGAPTGTPVRAVAGGTVEFAGWNGEAGRMVKLRHAAGYQTLYLHLSALGPGIRVGARVAQEQVIGKVGMTGSATGPHLDYRIIKNGVYVNPLAELNRMPKGEPIAPSALQTFARERDTLFNFLRVELAAPKPAPNSGG
jgi:murein DD-endopeptidase MepM/ murein hydrolase activator NlpD